MARKIISDAESLELEKNNTKDEKQRILLCVGPAEGNGAACFVFREDLTIHTNKELTIGEGEDITEQEAQLLLNETTWKFKEVTK